MTQKLFLKILCDLCFSAPKYSALRWSVVCIETKPLECSRRFCFRYTETLSFPVSSGKPSHYPLKENRPVKESTGLLQRFKRSDLLLTRS
jgi:hypothetical protein